MHYYFKVDWSKAKFVFCDERLVPFDDADSTYGVYKKSDIFKLEGVGESSFVVVDPTLEVGLAAKDYADKLATLNTRFASFDFSFHYLRDVPFFLTPFRHFARKLCDSLNIYPRY